MPRYRASWLLPIAQPPIKHGWVDISDNRIIALGGGDGAGASSSDIDLGNVAILPGLVNAHTHLELSWMRGLVPGGDDFPAWLRGVIALQKSGAPTDAPLAIREAIDEGRRSGTVLFGDISNTLSSVPPLMDAGAEGVVFHELIGFPATRAQQTLDDAASRMRALPPSDKIRYALAAHAPYSVSPDLFRGIRALVGLNQRFSVHLGESVAETQFLIDGTGPWRQLLEGLGTWDPSWVAPSSGPVEYLDRLGFLGDHLLAVHGVQFTRREMDRLRDHGVSIVTCPRGNVLTGAGVPPITEFHESGVNLAVGTDSLASVPDLNLFSELAEIRRIARALPAAAILAMATINGARALGFDADFGTIEPGKRDGLITVALPFHVNDVEEHLVRGIDAGDVGGL